MSVQDCDGAVQFFTDPIDHNINCPNVGNYVIRTSKSGDQLIISVSKNGGPFYTWTMFTDGTKISLVDSPSCISEIPPDFTGRRVVLDVMTLNTKFIFNFTEELTGATYVVTWSTILGQSSSRLSSSVSSLHSSLTQSPTQSPLINVSGKLNSVTFDILEVTYNVVNGEFLEDGLGRYCGSTIPTPDGTQIQVVGLLINPVVRGSGTLGEKVKRMVDTTLNDFQIYVLLLIILGRLVLFDKITLRSALGRNYCKLIATAKDSPYVGFALFIEANSRLQQYLEC